MRYLFVIMIIASLSSCQNNQQVKEETDSQELFYDGQILPPDYVHEDTLIVVDAKILNKLMPTNDGTDECIMEILCTGCKLTDYCYYMDSVKEATATRN